MAVLRARDAEVHHLDVAVRLHHDVLRLDVAVNDVVAVRDGEGLCDLAADLGYLLAVKRTVLAYAALEVGATQVLHDDVVGVAVLAPVVHGDDVRTLQRGGCLGLLLESCGKGGVGRILGQHRLDGDGSPQHLVQTAVDNRHAAGADSVLHGVAPAKNSFCHRHSVSSSKAARSCGVQHTLSTHGHRVAAWELDTIRRLP